MSIASPSRRTTAVGAVAVLTLSATLVTGWRPPPAVAAGSFRALAAADGTRVTVVAVNGPATNVPVDLGAPVAQASLDSLGTNQSFASQPYPGDAAVSAPGLMAGVTNGQVAPPNYPLYVSADYPLRPDQTVEQPGYQLKATAANNEAAASALTGARSADNSAAASSTTARTVSDGTAVTGEAATVATGFAAGPLTIARISSSAFVSRQPDGALTRRSGLEISGAKVGDTAVSISAKGITVGSGNTPVPGTSAAVVKLLSDAGVTLKYLAGTETENGLVAPALEVSWTHAVPGPVSPVTLISTLGRTVARIDGGGGSEAAVPGLGTAEATSAPSPPSEAVGDIVAPVGQGAPAVASAGQGSPLDVTSTSLDGPRPMEPVAGVSTSGETAPSPTPSATELAVGPAAALMPPDFDIRSSFAALALALMAGWVVTRRWKFLGRQSNN